MTVKITILYDNRCGDSTLQEGWGFSAFIEYEGLKILFDTGGDVAAFSSNREKMHLPYSEITHLLFSHRHWDHVAGSSALIQKLSTHTALYVPKRFSWLFLRRASAHLKNVRVVRSFEEIAPNVYSLVLKGGFWLYEQALVLKTPKGLGIVTGCAHPGIVEILKTAQEYLPSNLYFVVGGFHQLFTPAQESAGIVKQFQALKVQKVAPCHCSGDHLIRQFQETFHSDFSKVGTGTILNF